MLDSKPIPVPSSRKYNGSCHFFNAHPSTKSTMFCLLLEHTKLEGGWFLFSEIQSAYASNVMKFQHGIALPFLPKRTWLIPRRSYQWLHCLQILWGGGGIRRWGCHNPRFTIASIDLIENSIEIQLRFDRDRTPTHSTRNGIVSYLNLQGLKPLP